MAFLPARNMAGIVPIQVSKLLILTVKFVRTRLAWGGLRIGRDLETRRACGGLILGLNPRRCAGADSWCLGLPRRGLSFVLFFIETK